MKCEGQRHRGISGRGDGTRGRVPGAEPKATPVCVGPMADRLDGDVAADDPFGAGSP